MGSFAIFQCSFKDLNYVCGSFLNSILIAKMSSFLSSFIEMIVPKIHAEEEEDEPEAEAEEEAAEEEAAEEEAEEEEEEEEEDEEDLVDPHELVREQCVTDHCLAVKARLDERNARVESKNNTTETCFEEILDFYHCVDHCSSKIIMSKLK